jgi:hypothetical protein
MRTVTDSIIIARIWGIPKAYYKWTKLDTKAKQFVLKELGESPVTEAAVEGAIKAWKKKKHKKAVPATK